MGAEGYITLYRKIEEHWLWQDKPFTKGQAWIDLLFLANFADGVMLVKGALVEVKRGQVFRTHEFLRQRWGWGSIKKVRSFLTTLENEKMVTLKGTTQGTLITIENYTSYQLEGQTKVTPEAQAEGNQRAIKGQQNKKNKKEKEEKEVYKPDLSEFSVGVQQVINDWLAYKEERKEPYKETGLKAWLGLVRNKLKSYEDKYIIDVIKRSMASQYKGVVWDWLKDSPKRGKYKEYREEVEVTNTLSAEEQAENIRRMQKTLGGMFK